MEKLTIYKYSGLIRKSVTYGRKKFYNIGPSCRQLRQGHHCYFPVQVSRLKNIFFLFVAK
jgi:hypothetical protein